MYVFDYLENINTRCVTVKREEFREYILTLSVMPKETGKTFAQAAEEMGFQTLSQAQADEVWQEMGERGLPVSFKEGEIITFSDGMVKAIPFKMSNGKTTHTGHILAKSERQGGFFQCPLSIFRRAPIADEREQLYVPENSFGVKLLNPQTDLQRASILSGKVVKVERVLVLHKLGFNDGKPSYAEEDYRPIVCYLFSLVK